MKVGDIIRLKSIESLCRENKWIRHREGIKIEGRYINREMRYMFGKEWEVSELNVPTSNFDFRILDPRSRNRWNFMKLWIDDGNIIDVDELFEGIEL